MKTYNTKKEMNTQKINARKLLIIGIVIVLILIVIIGIFYFINKKIPITLENILGTWKGVSEEMNGQVNKEIDSVLTLNSDGTYNLAGYGIEETGMYKLIDDKILFYNSEEELNAYLNNLGRFNEVYGYIQNKQLVLIYPAYPKTDVYEKG